MPDLAFVLQLHQGADRFLEGHLRIGAVELIDIDLFDSETLQATLARGTQVLGTPIRLPCTGPRPVQPALGRDHEVLGVWEEGLRDQSFADLGPIGIGGVDEVDPELQRPPQHALAFLPVGRLSPDSFARDAHGAEPKAIDRKVTADVDGPSECGRDCARPICHDVLLANRRVFPTLGARPGTMPR